MTNDPKMPTIDEKFDAMLEKERRPIDDAYRDGPHYQQRKRDFLAGASAERKSILDIIVLFNPQTPNTTELRAAHTLCKLLTERIRQREEK